MESTLTAVPTLTADASAADILAAAEAYRAAHPRARARGVAAGLGISEAQLVAARTGDGVTRLRPAFQDLLMRVPELGPVMALTRNDACVHETTGTYKDGEMMPGPKMGLFVGKEIDLRLFFRRWTFAFFVEEDGRLSFQFFDGAGDAVHKVYAVDKKDIGTTDVAAMRALAAEFASDDPTATLDVTPYAAEAERDPSEIDLDAFHGAWRDLKDTHDFHGLLRTHGVSRRQAVRLAPEDLARPIADAATAARRVLTAARDAGLPIMVFVGNEGCVQIYTGRVERLVETGPWFNVLDARFNLHLDEAKVVEAYVVVKPTVDGVVTSVECFDADGALVVQFFGERKPGIPELQGWRDLVAGL